MTDISNYHVSAISLWTVKENQMDNVILTVLINSSIINYDVCYFHYETYFIIIFNTYK